MLAKAAPSPVVFRVEKKTTSNLSVNTNWLTMKQQTGSVVSSMENCDLQCLNQRNMSNLPFPKALFFVFVPYFG